MALNLTELKQAHKAHLDKAEALLGASDHVMTAAETEGYNTAMADARATAITIQAREEMSTIRSAFPNGRPLAEPSTVGESDPNTRWLTKEYRNDFTTMLRSRGHSVSPTLALGADEVGGFRFPALRGSLRGMNATAYEANASLGETMLPLLVQDTIIPLAPPEMGIESLSLVLPTTASMQFPRATGFGTAAAKAEGTGNGSNLFGGSDPTLDQVTINAFMAGHASNISWELAQDVTAFQAWLVNQSLLSQAMFKESLYWAGTGTGQAQGIKGNIGAGITANGGNTTGGVSASDVITGVSGTDSFGSALIDSTFDVMGALNAEYHNNASFLMNRATSIFIRKAQKQANLFEPVFSRVGGQDYLHNYPVKYSQSVDSYGTVGNVPIVFGDFRAAYLIGLRGGAGVSIKILDQPKALEGLLTIITYQRMDARVIRSEALQPITIAS